LDVKSNFSIGEHTVSQMAAFAQSLGWKGIVVCDLYKDSATLDNLNSECKEASEKTGIEVYSGVTIQPKDPKELKKLVSETRDKVMLLIVQGGTYQINRAACENPYVDILMSPEQNRPDNGLDEPCFTAAQINGVSIGLNFRQLLNTYRKIRSRLLDFSKINIKLCKKYAVPLVVVSGAQSMMDMRDPRQLVSIANVLGMDLPHAFNLLSSIPQQIIEKNQKRLEGKIIGKGVEKV